MKTHTITNELRVELPDNYQRVPLPFFDEWVEALESGRFKQGRERLETAHGFCCLGVYCKIQGVATGTRKTLSPDIPGCEVLGDIGYFSPAKVFYENFRSVALIDLNDFGCPFSEIAQVIKLIWCPPCPSTPTSI